MTFYDTFPSSNTFDGERRLSIGGLTNGDSPAYVGPVYGGVGGFPNIGYGQQQPEYGGPGNTSEAWANGVNRVDRFARDQGIPQGRAYRMVTGRIDARAPQAQVTPGLQTPTMTGVNSLTNNDAWNRQFQQGQISGLPTLHPKSNPVAVPQMQGPVNQMRPTTSSWDVNGGRITEFQNPDIRVRYLTSKYGTGSMRLPNPYA